MQRNNKPGRIIKGTAKQPTLKDASGIWSLDDALQAHRANAWPQPDLLQPIPKSLRVKWQSSGNGLYRYGVRGDQRKFTFSGWVKRNLKTSVDDQELISAAWGSTYYAMHIAFSQANDGIQIYDWGPSGGGTFSIQTVPVFKDTNAWYHVVVAVDTTQSVAQNRIKIWVNGVQIIDFTNQNGWNAAEGGWPPQNYVTPFNKQGGLITVGTSANADSILSSKVFDGYLAEFNYIDGFSINTPSLFGTTGPSGTWIPIEYTGNYGANGFYLPFDNTISSQTVGFDASPTKSTTYTSDYDPYRGSVSLHLTGNGPAAGQNNIFVDSGPNNIAITKYGNTTQGAFGPFSYDTNLPYNPAVNGASAYFDGDSDYLRCTGTALGSGNFTIELWSYPLELRANAPYFDTTGGLMFRQDTANILVYDRSNATSWSTTGNLCKVNTWNHIAVVRNSGTITVYINGVNAGSSANSTNFTPTDYWIGGFINAQATPTAYYGYLSNYRVTVGTAIYTSNFNPVRRPFGASTVNLLSFSEDFTNSYWTQQNASLNTNAVIAPDGTPTATKLFSAYTGSYAPQIYKYQNANLSNSTTYTFSVYAKAGEYNYLVMNHNDGLGSYRTWFNLANGTVGTNGSGNTASISAVGNGWYRCVVYRTMAATSATNSLQGLQVSNADNADTFSATLGYGIYIWGAQVELGTTATTYIPTPANFPASPSLLLNFANAAIVDSTGNNNLATNTNATISASSKYGTGAVYFDGTASTFLSLPYSDRFAIGSNDYTVECWVNLSAYGEIVGAFNLTSPFPGWLLNVGNFSTSGKIAFWLANGSVSQTFTGTNTVPLNTWTHVAVVKQNNFLKMFINGQLDSSHSITLTSTGSSQQINIGSDANSLTAPGRRITGYLDDLRITKGVARYWDSFIPPTRALPEVGGKSFVTKNINVGVVRTFTTNNLNIVGAKIYHVTTAPRSANYSVEYSDNNIDWTTAFSGVMSSMDGTVGIKVGTVTSGGSGTTGTGTWGAHPYWRYVEGATISGHHPRCSRIILTDINGVDYNFRIFANDNSADQGEYQIGTKAAPLQGPTLTTSWTAPSDVTQVEVLVVGGGGSGGANNGAGGGAGGLIYNNAYPVTPGTTYTVTVGKGGAQQFGSGGWSGAVGSNSQFGSLIAYGGGGGSGGNVAGTYSGGSGGGACRSVGPGTGVAGQGFSGGANRVSPEGGGGGGAGMVGFVGDGSTYGGKGGDGLQFGISGTPTYYAGGGGGGAEGTVGSPRAGAGGQGGGGAGGNSAGATAAPGWNGYTFNSGTYTNFGQDATPHTGGGGGGEASGAVIGANGFGGNGIVILRYTTATEASSYTDDTVIESPTNYGHDTGAGGEVIGNYCTLNPLTNTKVSNIGTLTEGNLNFTGIINQRPYINGTMFVSSGKWYCEVTVGTFGNAGDTKYVGIINIDVNAATNATIAGTTSGYFRGFTNAFSNDLSFNDGAGTQTNQLASANFWSTDNTTYGLAIDIDNNTMSLYKNGVLAYTKTSANLSGYSWTVFNEMESSASRTPATNWRYNFGQRPWVYTPPAGYNAWNTKNLPILTAPAAINPNQYFDTVTWISNSSDTSKSVTGLNFQPDLVWIKTRNTAQNHYLIDSVRGGSAVLRSNTTAAESTGSVFLSSFDSTGFTYTNNLIGISDPYVAWCWKAGGAAVTNTDGTITSQVSANTASGFSIVTWTGNGIANATIGHGLGATPKLIITKQRNQTGDWYSYTTVLDGSNRYLKLNAKDWSGTTGLTAASSTVIRNDSWTSASNMVAYCWAEVPGFSKIGTYRANDSTNGPFVNCGFKPRWIMVKTGIDTNNAYPAGNSWEIYDTARNTVNTVSSSGSIFAEETSAESSRASFVVTANGFKVVSSGSRTNYPTAAVFLFMAFADTPFKNALAASAPVTTRTATATVFSYTGADQSYVVPPGVNRIKVAAWGAGGSAGTPTSGGALTGDGGGAGSVEGYLDVIPGETLTIKVGQGVDALSGTVGNGANTGTILAASVYGGGGVNGQGDGAGSNAGTAGAGGGASSIVRGSTYVLVAAGGGGAAGAGYTGANPSASGGAGGAGAGTGGTGRGSAGTFTSGQGTYAGYPGTNGGGGGGGGGSGSNSNLGNGDPGLGGSNTVPVTCTGYSGSGRTPGNTSSAYYDGAAGYGGIAPVAGGSITTPDGRIVIVA